MKAICALLFFALAASSCGRPDESEVVDVLEAQCRAWNDGSIEGYMQGYWNSDSVTFVSGGSVTRGYEEVLGRYRRGYASREQMGELTFTDLQVEFLSSTSAIAAGAWHLGRSSGSVGGRFTLLLKKLPEGWRIVYDHTSAATN